MRRFLVFTASIIALFVIVFFGLPQVQRLLAPPTPVPTLTPAPADVADCPANVLSNGGFEQGTSGWEFSGSQHGVAIESLPLVDTPNLLHGGKFAAHLGGFETASDRLAQSFIVPPGGQLSVWWMYHYPDPIKDRDAQVGRIVLPNNEEGLPVFYAGGDAPQDAWQNSTLDLSAYAGQRVTLEFTTYNDNYYAAWLVLDDICVQPGQ